MGTTWPVFQPSSGTMPDCKDLLNIIAKGIHMMSLDSLRTAGGQPSGPGNLLILRDFSLSKTD